MLQEFLGIFTQTASCKSSYVYIEETTYLQSSLMNYQGDHKAISVICQKTQLTASALSSSLVICVRN